MRGKFSKKTISLLLVLTIMVPLASPAFAAEGTDESEVMLSSEGFLGDTIEVIKAAELFGGGHGGWTLEKIAGGTVSGLVGMGLNQAFKAIFGDKEQDILKALAELSKQISQIDAKMDKFQKQANMMEMTNFLNHYRSEIAPYKALFEHYQTAIELYGEAKTPKELEQKKQFLLNIYYGTDPNLSRHNINIMGIVREIKTLLVDTVWSVKGQSCNIFGAFDLLDKHISRWEHQGYQNRKEFRGVALGIFYQYAALAEIAYAEVIADCTARNDTAGLNTANLAKENLKKDVDAVEKMKQRCAVIEHPNLRIFRDTVNGKDLHAFYPRVDVAQMDYTRGDDISTNEFIQCMTTTNHVLHRAPGNGGTEVISPQVWIGDLKDVHKEYGGEKTIYDILFDPNEGNFINVGKLPKGTRFATDYYLFKLLDTWITNVLNDKAQSNEGVTLLRLRNNTVNKEKFFSVMKYHSSINQGALKYSPNLPASETSDMISGMESPYELPCNDSVTLSVDEVEDAAYQWLVDTSGSGEEFEEIAGETSSTYTLPLLEASMNGWMYRCAIISGPMDDPDMPDSYYMLADPVTLVLTGEGIPMPVTVHDVNSDSDLENALEKVADGSWDDHTIKLMDDILYPHPISMTGGRDVTIDLNGYILTVQPDSNAEPNINPISNMEEIAAIYVHFGSLRLIGEGELKVIADEGISYGIYAGESGGFGNFDDPNDGCGITVVSTDGGTGLYVADGGIINAGSISAGGQGAHAIMNFGGNVYVKNVTVGGKSCCGVYADSSDGIETIVLVDGNLSADGENCRGASLNSDGTYMELAGSVSVTGQDACGVIASNGDYSDTYMAWIGEDVSAPDVAVSASAGAGIRVSRDVISTGRDVSAIYAIGGSVAVDGNVTSTGINGTAISASKWDLIDPTAGAFVMVDGEITAHTPLRIESLPVGENEHTGEIAVFGHYIYTDGINTVWANPGALISTDKNAQAPSITAHPEDSTVEPNDVVTLSVSAKISDGGMLSFQWYSNTTENLAGSTLIAGATNTTYTPSTDMLGTRYYYVIVTNTNEAAPGEKTSQVISRLATVLTTYTVTFDQNGGDSEANPATKEANASGNVGILPTAPTRGGYNFKGWNTQADGSGIAFTAATPVTASMTVYAQWSRRSSDGGSTPGSGPQAQVGSDKAEITVNAKTGSAMIKINADQLGGKTTTVIIPQIPNVSSYQMGLPAASISGHGDNEITFKTAVATLTIPSNMLTDTDRIGENAQLSVATVQPDMLSDEARAAVGNRPVVSLSLMLDGQAVAWNNPHAPVMVGMPYTPTAYELENPQNLVVWYIDGMGNLIQVPGARYDAETGLIFFDTTHFSYYAVGYLSFADVLPNAWYFEAVSFVAENGITSGTAKGKFSPDATLTRGQFITLLMRAYEIAPDENPTDNFSDGGNTYYTGYIAAAKRMGISNGIGDNRFAPEAAITRQQMFTLLYNALHLIDRLPDVDSGKTLADFSDNDSIASWATGALTALVKSGIVSGSCGCLNPTNTTTRAEMAQILYSLLAKSLS